MRPEREILKNQPDAALVGRHHVAPGVGHPTTSDPDFSGIGLFESRDEPQHGRLAAAAGPEQSDAFAVLNLEGERLDREVPAEVLGDLQELEQGWHHCSRRIPSMRAIRASGARTTVACSSARAAT